MKILFLNVAIVQYIIENGIIKEKRPKMFNWPELVLNRSMYYSLKGGWWMVAMDEKNTSNHPQPAPLSFHMLI